jgi:branched-subunit amino acid aminotransferase/4-amino-4-deoxychorismate lyase
MGVFEGIRAYKTPQGTAIFRLPEHVKRLFNGTKIFQMNMPYSQEEITKGIIDVVNSNKLEACYIRPIIFIGSQKLGISPKGNSIHTAIAASSEDVLIYPSFCEFFIGACKSFRLLHQLDFGESRSNSKWI